MTDKKNNEWIYNYQEFINGNEHAPTELNNKVYDEIKSLLNPNSFVVFSKVLGIHFAVGFLSLSVCHQFGINPFNTKRSLADWMMDIGGHHFCMVGCGVLFLGLSILAAGIFLTIEEVNALKRTQYLQTLVLGLISLGIFVSFGAEFAFGIAMLWLIGGLAGGVAATQTILRVKRV